MIAPTMTTAAVVFSMVLGALSGLSPSAAQEAVIDVAYVDTVSGRVVAFTRGALSLAGPLDAVSQGTSSICRRTASCVSAITACGGFSLWWAGARCCGRPDRRSREGRRNLPRDVRGRSGLEIPRRPRPRRELQAVTTSGTVSACLGKSPPGLDLGCDRFSDKDMRKTLKLERCASRVMCNRGRPFLNALEIGSYLVTSSVLMGRAWPQEVGLIRMHGVACLEVARAAHPDGLLIIQKGPCKTAVRVSERR